MLQYLTVRNRLMLTENSTFKQNDGKEKVRIEVFLRLHNGNGCLLTVCNTITFADFKKKIEETKLELPSEYSLIFQGKRLAKTEGSLSSLGIVNGSIVHIDGSHDFSSSKLMLDVCFFHNAEKMVVRASRQETIIDLKTKIYRLINVLPRFQMIIFRGSKLEDINTLLHYHIAQDSLLCLQITGQLEQRQNLAQTPFTGKRELLRSTVSANFSKMKKKGNMYRSQSVGMEKEPAQIEIRENYQELLESQDFKYQFAPMQMPYISELQESGSNIENHSGSYDQENHLLPNQKKLIK